MLDHTCISDFMMFMIGIIYFTLTSSIGQKEFVKGKAFIYNSNNVFYADIYSCN